MWSLKIPNRHLVTYRRVLSPYSTMGGRIFLLTTAFVVGQLIAWQQLQSSGQFITSNPANAFFYFLTGAHAVHIIGGMYVWARATAGVVLGKRDAPAIARSIELCAIYWHFLLLVWLVLFGLLLST